MSSFSLGVPHAEKLSQKTLTCYPWMLQLNQEVTGPVQLVHSFESLETGVGDGGV